VVVVSILWVSTSVFTQRRRNEFASGGTGPARKWSCPSTFLALKVQLVVLVSRFHDGQYSVVSFLFAVLLLTVPPCPAICKSGARVPRALWSRQSAPLSLRDAVLHRQTVNNLSSSAASVRPPCWQTTLNDGRCWCAMHQSVAVVEPRCHDTARNCLR